MDDQTLDDSEIGGSSGKNFEAKSSILVNESRTRNSSSFFLYISSLEKFYIHYYYLLMR